MQTIIFSDTCVSLLTSFEGLILLLNTQDQTKLSPFWENKGENCAVAGANPNLYVHLLTDAIRKWQSPSTPGYDNKSKGASAAEV